MCPQPRLRRRTLLAGAAGSAIAVSGGWTLAGCTTEPDPPPPPDPFEPLIASAAAHADLADAVAAAHPALAAGAQLVAADRRVHGEALTAEVRRATPSPPTPTGPTTPSAGSSAGPPAPTDPATAKAALLGASASAQRQAAELVGTLPRYRAGLVASVAACCASHAVVLG